MEVRDRLALALDVDDLVVALRLARRLAPWFGVAKVGLELFTAAGPDAVKAMQDLGFRVFLDLKLHDIPNTVAGAAPAAAGADLLVIGRAVTAAADAEGAAEAVSAEVRRAFGATSDAHGGDEP